MRARVRSEWPWWAAAFAGVAVMSWLTLQGFAWSDYDLEVASAFKSLIDGDFHGFLAQAPAYGGSLVLRSPFAGVTVALGGGELAVFRAVSIPCLLAVGWLGLVLVRRMGARGRSNGVRALVLGLCVANPLTIRALEMGHPEELLCAALAIGALLAAIDGRAFVAAVLLGLAIATKSWAVLAIGPVLLALPGRRLPVLAIAGAATATVIAPLLLAQGGAQAGTTLVAAASTTGDIFTPSHVFWFLGEQGNVVLGSNGLPKAAGWRVPPQWLSPLTHPLIAFLVVPLSLCWTRAHRAARGTDPHELLLLLALLLFLRCVLDPWNIVYYELPFVLALLAWEATCRPDRPPVLALAASAVSWFTFMIAPNWLSPDLQSILFVAWALPVTAWMGHAVFARSDLAPAQPRRAPAPSRPGLAA